MPKFLFWNLHGNHVAHLLKELASQHDVDVLVLAECANDTVAILESLNEQESAYEYCPGNCDRLEFFTKFDSSLLVPLFETDRISIRRLSLPGRETILIAGAHLPSKLHFSDESLIFECTYLAERINDVEKQEGHSRTIVVGDLNVNPFETGMIGSSGLNAVMSRRVANRELRTVQGRQYRFFYNPMWTHFGDRMTDVAGTFFYDKAEHVTYYWNIFDQVLIRPALLKAFAHEQVQILATVGATQLVDAQGHPNSQVGSDHLPVLLDLNF